MSAFSQERKSNKQFGSSINDRTAELGRNAGVQTEKQMVPPSLAQQRMMAKDRLRLTADRPEIIAAADRLDEEIGNMAFVLGNCTIEPATFLDKKFVTNLHSLASRGFSAQAMVEFFRRKTLGEYVAPIAFEGNIAWKADAKVEQIPNILKYRGDWNTRPAAFRSYAAALDNSKFNQLAYLDTIKAHLEANKVAMFGMIKVSVVIVLRDEKPGRSSVANGVRQTFDALPAALKSFPGTTVKQGDNLREWHIQVGNAIGVGHTKREARMVAIIRGSVDPEFTTASPAMVPPASLMAKFDKHAAMMRMLR